MDHDLKIWPRFFNVVERGDKSFEVRKDDRNYAVGDMLFLREWEPTEVNDGFAPPDGRYTGRVTEKVVIYKMSGGQFGIAPGFCVLGVVAVPTSGGER